MLAAICDAVLRVVPTDAEDGVGTLTQALIQGYAPWPLIPCRKSLRKCLCKPIAKDQRGVLHSGPSFAALTFGGHVNDISVVLAHPTCNMQFDGPTWLSLN